MAATIHCPGCGTEASTDTKVLSLLRILSGEGSPSGRRTTFRIRTDHHKCSSRETPQRQQNVERWLSQTGVGFTALMALSVLTGLIYLLLVGSLPIVPGIVLLTLVLGGSIAGLLAMYSEKLKKTLSGNNSPRSKQLPEGVNAIEAYEVRLISVTERTTNLLQKDVVETGNERRKKS